MSHRIVKALMAGLAWATVIGLQAGHSVMIHLGVYDLAPIELDRGSAPVSIGVPVPQSAELTDLQNLVLVGADLAQLRPLSHWPDGSVRWLQIDALVSLPAGQKAVALHLTTGQAVESQSSLAEEREGEVFVETGVASFAIPKNGPVVLHQITLGDVVLSGATLRLGTVNQDEGNLRRVGVTVEKNGPVAAVVAIEEIVDTATGSFDLTTRVFSYRGRAQIKIEVAAHRSASASSLVAIPEVNLRAEGMIEEAGDVSDIAGRFWRQYRYRVGDHELLFCIDDRGPQKSMPSSENGPMIRLIPAEDEGLNLGPGSLVRREVFLDLIPKENSTQQLANPLFGKGASVAVFNDSETLVEKVLADSPDSSQAASTASPSFDNVERSLYQTLGQTQPANDGGFVTLKGRIDELLETGTIMQSLAGEAISLWYFLTGDEAVRALYLDWGRWFDDQLQSSPDRMNEVAVLAQLLDLYRVTGAEETRDRIWRKMESWLTDAEVGGEPLRQRAASAGRPWLVLLANLIRHGSYDESIDDRLLDALETLVYSSSGGDPSDCVFSEGYLLTGDPEFLERGQAFLASETDPGSGTSLRHLIAAPRRQLVWRELSMQTKPERDGTTRLSWTVPERAIRIRIKHANRPIVFGSVAEGEDVIPFRAAKNLEGEPDLLARNEEQSFHAPFDGNTTHFAGRYLERGVALPAPTPVRRTMPPKISEDPLGLDRGLQILIVGIGVLAIAFFLKKRASKRAQN